MRHTNGHKSPIFDTQELVAELQEKVEKAQAEETPSGRLWRQLCTIEIFREMSGHDQLLTWGCLTTKVTKDSLKLSSAKQYGR